MEQKRKYKRLPTNLKAEYSLKAGEAEGSTLFLKIFDPEGKEAFDAEGIVRWNKQGEKDFVCGVELTTVLDKFTLSTLGV